MKTLRLLPLAVLYALAMIATGLFMSVAFAQAPVPTGTPAPLPLPLPGQHTLSGDLTQLVAATGLFGSITWAISAGIFHWWKQMHTDINNDWKIIISVAVAVAVGGAAYALGALHGDWMFSGDGLYQTLWRAGQAALGSKAIFGATTLIERVWGNRPGN